MIGLAALGLTVVMIYNLVKNALTGTQLSEGDEFPGYVDVIIPVSQNSQLYFDAWEEALKGYKVSGYTRIHFLIDGHNPQLEAWERLRLTYSHIEIHNFLMRPIEMNPVPWMIGQISSKLKGEIIVIGDSESAATETAFRSIAANIAKHKCTYFVIPQTAKLNTLNEAINVLNPTLALTSIFGFHKFSKNFSHPLIGLSDGWFAMDLATFQSLDLSKVFELNWKEGISRQLDSSNRNLKLAFGEKFIKRFYPVSTEEQKQKIIAFWPKLWSAPDHTGAMLFILTLFLWSFPFIFFMTNPIWSIAGLGLLLIYRFFTKIVYQESWTAVFLHPVAVFIYLASLANWIFMSLKARFSTR